MIKTIIVAGPTAVGKTEYSLRLAEDLKTQIVSADSMQIYKYMDIGSAKPTEDELSRIRHYLIGEIDPKDSFSVYDYQKLAKDYIKNISDNNMIPLVCGGTGLYINSLIYDMDFSAPSGDDDFRNQLLAKYEGDGEKLYNRLKELDPSAALEIHPNNVKRVLRAVERLEKGEKKLSSFAQSLKPSTEIEPILIGLTRDRDELYDRCNRRVDAIIRAGLAEEVQRLTDMGFTKDDIAMKGIGYKEVMEAVDLGLKPEDAAEAIKLNTRHLAKRQLTWFRRYENMKWFTLKGDSFNEDVYQEIKNYVCSKN